MANNKAKAERASEGERGTMDTGTIIAYMSRKNCVNLQSLAYNTAINNRNYEWHLYYIKHVRNIKYNVYTHIIKYSVSAQHDTITACDV